MPRQNTHLYQHMDNTLEAYVLPLTRTKRIIIRRFIGQDRLLYVPQCYYGRGGVQWHYIWTRSKVWATFSMDNALDKLQIEPTGMWRVYYFNDITTDVVEVVDMLSQKKPTKRANARANGRHYEIIPLR